MRDTLHRFMLGKGPWVTPLWRVVAALALLVALVGVLPWASRWPGAGAQEPIIALPDAPGLAAPVDGAILDDPTSGVVLAWSAVPGADDYQVVLNDGQRTSPWVTETSWSPGTLPDGAYDWAVRARNAAGVSEPGPAYNFTIPSDGMAAPASDATTTDLPPVPLPLEQQTGQGQQGQDGVESASPDPNVAGPAPSSALAPAPEAAPAGTPAAAGTPAPVDDQDKAAARAARKADRAAGTPEPEAASAGSGDDIVVVPATDSATGADAERDGGGDKDKDKDKKDRESREKRERKDREPKSRYDANGNGGVSEVVAAPPEYRSYSFQIPEELREAAYQQDATDATAGSAGEDGTVNGQPRETADSAPPETAGPGAPGAVILPPPVPGLPVTDGSVPVIGSTTELGFDAVSDATVFMSSPGSPQSPESVNYLALGGPQGAVSLISFKVEGVGDGTVLAARLTFQGAGTAGAPGGGVGVIYDYVVPEGATANGVPSSETALNVHGAPAWFERVEPNGLTAVDVTGSVSGDGRITFVLPGQPEAAGSLFALESGTPPQLLLTVALPAE